MEEIETDFYRDYKNVIYVYEEQFLYVKLVNEDNRVTTHNRMLPVHYSERELSGGRFWNYHPHLRTHPVTIRVGLVFDPHLHIFTMGRIFEWLAENCEEAWAFHMSYDTDLALTIFFESVQDKVLYRLSLSRGVIDENDE